MDRLDQAFETHWDLEIKQQENLIQGLHQHEQDFTWTPLWFEKYEMLILQISYYPQLSLTVSQSAKFIQQKIITTHVSQFNKFLALYQAPLIDHHYDWLKKNPHQICWGNLSGNSQAIDLLKTRLSDFKLLKTRLDGVINNMSQLHP